jgi:hypothetical protein
MSTESNTSQRQIQIVVDYDEIFRTPVKFAKQISNRRSAAIHKRLGFDQDNSLVVDAPFGD